MTVEPQLIDEVTKKSAVLKTLTSNNSDEHNTPSFLIEAAREVMEGIDLDPMSNKAANKIVRATNLYTKEDDGLSKDWEGKVWLNPPFSLANKAVEKLIDSYENGKVTHAVLLVKSAVDTIRYQKLYPYPFCELNGRVKFEAVDNKSPAPFATVLFYFGNEFYKWNEVMSRLGRVHLGHKLTTQILHRCDTTFKRDIGVIE
jgi:hypothetical protein